MRLAVVRDAAHFSWRLEDSAGMMLGGFGLCSLLYVDLLGAVRQAS